MTTIELLYTEPFSAKVQTRHVANVDEVVAFADDLLALYQTVGDMLPGIDLRRNSGDSLSIAIAPASVTATASLSRRRVARRHPTKGGWLLRVKKRRTTALPPAHRASHGGVVHASGWARAHAACGWTQRWSSC